MTERWVQNPETWDHFEDNRQQNPLNNDTYVSLENNAGFTSLVAALNAVCPCLSDGETMTGIHPESLAPCV